MCNHDGACHRSTAQVFGDEVCPGIKAGGRINWIKRTIPCAAPGDRIPRKFEVDIRCAAHAAGALGCRLLLLLLLPLLAMSVLACHGQSPAVRVLRWPRQYHTHPGS